MADIKPTKPIIKDAIRIVIRNRQGVVIDEEVKAVSSLNEKGIFDVLPQHENFISMIKEIITVHKKTGDKKELKINQGIIKVYENEAFIYLDVTH